MLHPSTKKLDGKPGRGTKHCRSSYMEIPLIKQERFPVNRKEANTPQAQKLHSKFGNYILTKIWVIQCFMRLDKRIWLYMLWPYYYHVYFLIQVGFWTVKCLQTTGCHVKEGTEWCREILFLSVRLQRCLEPVFIDLFCLSGSGATSCKHDTDILSPYKVVNMLAVR